MKSLYILLLTAVLAVGCDNVEKCKPHKVTVYNIMSDNIEDKNYVLFVGSSIGDSDGCIIQEYVYNHIYINPILNHSEIR